MSDETKTCAMCGVALHDARTAEAGDPQADCGGDCWGCVSAVERALGWEGEDPS